MRQEVISCFDLSQNHINKRGELSELLCPTTDESASIDIYLLDHPTFSFNFTTQPKSKQFVRIFVIVALIVFVLDTCRGRWQFRDALDVKVTFDWEINQENQEITIEFRTNIIAKGFWHGFTVSSDRSPSVQTD